jgi:hypothetical protein
MLVKVLASFLSLIGKLRVDQNNNNNNNNKQQQTQQTTIAQQHQQQKQLAQSQSEVHKKAGWYKVALHRLQRRPVTIILYPL